ncbi:DUF2778 domain-containing protein [Bradyrhizobium sp.]|uniref:DUF2778 domain-containing protein n=1 Tax=Bradyrhizobium sp. TaxID=376 RepID=UPI002728950C|nr:DUF2778 domain-containing protein [Bradyrhizobium sp.]MDO9294684.1 DUF2778 domain-containing protein [Bradyrhizobium sp.]
MTYTPTTAGKLWSRYSMLFISRLVPGIAALALAAVASWVGDFIPVAAVPVASDVQASSFSDRFDPGPASDSVATDFARRFPDRSLSADNQVEREQAKRLLAENLKAGNWQASPAMEPAAPAPLAIAVPLPKPRPVETALAAASTAPAAQASDRTLLQKLSDLLPARLTLASLAPNGGLLGNGPDLAALGYDSLTAVYDISARTVYMPDGARLEAHSGMGSMMDDPTYVGERDLGPTPPNVYDLKPRERPFHGVKALRMIPQDEGAALGRDGLLTHSYLLGPNGDSNGCVSFRNYDKFLTAFQSGEVKRLVVVTSLSETASASRKPDSPS